MMEKLYVKYNYIVNEKYYFIEVNPTGEWGWLEVKTGMNISETIRKALGEEIC